MSPRNKMKIAIAYPPLESEKGVPLLSQNRQFQWFPSLLTTYSIYPVVPASAATLLKKAGHEIYWLDGIAEKWSYKKWEKELQKIKPDLVFFETKTPVVKRYWKIIDNLKDKRNKTRYILVGDHVTALPEESMENSKVDYILTGGDYDFLLLNLVNHLIKGEKLEPGIWYRNETLDMKSEIKNTGKFQLNHDLNSLPTIDRKLTKWELYAYKNSNFYRAPGAYTMFGRDCWWGRCTFCSWTTLYPGAYWRVVKVEKALDEIGFLINKY
ncbi:cobalamin-dependent protein, partial [Patescibacteria group bacterium]|nr:cobalamin-dependent protein [Patescibacteria group bacterium]